MTMLTVLICCIIFFQMMMLGCQATCLEVNSCSCETGSSGVIINCRNQNLERIPLFKNANTNFEYYELTLENNQIEHIDGRAFAMLKVQRIVLKNNPIISISDEAFSGVEIVLMELVLELSNSAEFPTSSLALLTQLRLLDVTGFGKPFLPSGALASLTNLQKLSLTSGKLLNLTVTDFISQQDSLRYLDLSSNHLTEIPVAAISSLKSLSSLYLNLNTIVTIRANSFSGLQLQALDLSRNSISDIEPNAFSGLESHLQNLTMQICHLVDRHLQPLRVLTSLVRLDICDNNIISISSLLSNMKSLQELKLARNKITSITRSVYSVLSSSLLKLDLIGNPITEMSPDAFSDLNLLQELYIDGALRLQLNEDSFKSQQPSLKILSLRGADLSSSQWSSINNLTGLKTLWLSSCKLGNIPDFTFGVTNQLENLDLNSNSITSITQRSLTGLENSLVKLYLSQNKLITLNQCVFHQFTKIDLLQLQLTNNPLQCDCNLKWLHDRLQPFKMNPDTTFRVALLRWTCDNLNGRFFNNLTDDDFSHCLPTNQTCEDFVGTTTTTTSLPGDKITLTVIEVTARSMTLMWYVSESIAVQTFKLRYKTEGSNTESELSIQPDARNKTLSDLTPATTYTIGLETITVDGTWINTSISSSTNSEDVALTQSQLQLILGLTLGVGLTVLFIIIVVTVLAIKKSKHGNMKNALSPKMGVETKRFIKPSDQQRTSSSITPHPGSPPATETVTDNIIAQTLETMSDEEKFRLVNLLTNSRGSMDSLHDIIGSSNYKRQTEIPARFGDPFSDKHVYEEIPDDYYEEIPTDDTV